MNGIIIIDKPAGKTSHDVVQEIKKILDAEKVGHTGTLDPLATGVLPLCINEATKLAQFFSLDAKEYRATLLLGVGTDTYDVEGTIIAEEESTASPAEIAVAIGSLVGRRAQIPPPYSAVKHRGKPLYRWARKGISVAAPPRDIEIYQSRLEEVDLPYVTFRVSCSKGTYVRSLCLEIGEMLGCCACLAALRRTRSGPFTEETALAIAGIAPGARREALQARLIPMAEALPHLAAVPIDGPLAERLRKGYQPDGDSLLPYDIPFLAAGDMLKFTTSGSLVAIANARYPSDQFPILDGHEQAVRILRVFNGD